MNRNAVTITDISKRTGLSVYVISRALNGKSGVAQETRSSILKVADEMGYVPNSKAQDLRTGRNRSITLLTAGMSNSYYLDLISGIESVLQGREESLFIADLAVNGRYEEDNETSLLRRVAENRPGGIISTLGLSDRSRRMLRGWGVPTIFVDSTPEVEGVLQEDSGDGFSYVTTDNVDAAEQLGAHLNEHGFRKWLLAIYPDIWNSRYARERSLVSAATKSGAEIRVIECGNNEKDACATMLNFMDTQGYEPDVVIAGNNPILLGVMSAFQTRGVRIPVDVGLVTFDDFAWSDLLSPRITLVAENSHLIGVNAANFLLEQIEEGKEASEGDGPTMMPKPVRRMIKSSLKVRESCGCLTR